MSAARWQAPRDSGGTLVAPPWEELPELVRQNRRLIAGASCQLSGLSLLELRALAAQDVIARVVSNQHVAESPKANQWLNGPVIGTGHQPELFHAGVLAKNFAIAQLARQVGGVGLILSVDSDLVKSTSLAIPDPHEQTQHHDIVFSQIKSPLPFEEWRCSNETAFASVINQADEWMRSWPWKPIFHEFWSAAVQCANQTPKISNRWVMARQALESRWGVNNCEVLLSDFCRGDFFGVLLGEFVVRRQELVAIYNDELRRYRKARRIRSKNHPVADLQLQGDEVELPFWCWKSGHSQRGRLFVREKGGNCELVCRGAEAEPIVMGRWNSGQKDFIKEWSEMRDSDWKIRPKALIISMMMRLFVCDLFVHGIGGAVYDELTDLIFSRFFDTELPQFAVVTATLRLPWELPELSEREERQLLSDLRGMRWNPDRYLAVEAKAHFDVQHYLRLKKQLIAADSATLEGKDRYALFRTIQEGLQPYVAEIMRQTEGQLRESRVKRKRQEVLRSREYPWVFHSEAALKTLISAFNNLGK